VKTKPLPKKVQKRVKTAGKDAAALEKIATSSAYGAPQQSLPVRSQTTTRAQTQPTTTRPVAKKKPAVSKHRATRPATVAPPKKHKIPTVAVTVKATDTGVESARVIGLLAVLFAVTIAIFAAARRRGGRNALAS
jgi:hypothetical protein